jgi:hypothetical protein
VRGENNSRRPIPIEAIKKVLVYRVVRSSEGTVYDGLLLALEGYTLFYREALRAAYLYGRMIVETGIDRMWKEYVTSLKISSDDKSNLKDSGRWTIQHKTEVLFASQEIHPKYRDLLKRLRKKRNDIMHEKQAVSRREAFGCLRVATVTTLNRVSGNTDIFHDPKEKQLVEEWDRIESESKYRKPLKQEKNITFSDRFNSLYTRLVNLDLHRLVLSLIFLCNLIDILKDPSRLETSS